MSKHYPSVVYLKQQLRAKIPVLAIWIVVWSLLLLLFAVVFNSLSKDAAESSKVFQQLPSGVFNSFNIDPSSYLTRVESFISGQFLSVYLLAGSIFAFSMGVGSIGKKIESRTIASQLTKPVSRPRLYLLEFAANCYFLIVGSIVLCGVALALFNALVTTQSTISTDYFVSLFLGSCLLFMAFAGLGQCIGMILNGGRSVLVGAAIVIISWFVNSLAPLVHMPSVVQKISLFHYFDVSLLRTDYVLALGLTVQLTITALVICAFGCATFKNKNIYI